MRAGGCSSWRTLLGTALPTPMVSSSVASSGIDTCGSVNCFVRDAAARQTYEEAKLRLAERFPDGRKDYLSGKDPTVRKLLASDA